MSNVDINKILVFFGMVGVIFMNFTFGYISNFPVTIGTVSLFIIIPILIRKAKFESALIYCYLFFVIYPMLLSPEIGIEFLKSYSQYLMLFTAGLLALQCRPLGSDAILYFFKLSNIFAIVISSLVILQFVTFNLFDSTFLLNPYGEYSAIGPGGEIYEPHSMASVKRPNAIYSEPSICGWILSLLAGISIFGYRLKYISKSMFFSLFIIITISAILTFSLSGILNIIILWGLFLLFNSNGRFAIPKKMATVIVPVIFIFVAFELGLLNRLQNVSIEGTSVYFRVVAPLILVIDSFIEYPFGFPLGDLSFIEQKPYMINWDGGNSTNIENGFFVLFHHLGIVGIIIFILVVKQLLNYLVNKNELLFLTLPVFLALLQTGAIWSPNIILMICIVFVVCRAYRFESS